MKMNHLLKLLLSLSCSMGIAVLVSRSHMDQRRQCRQEVPCVSGAATTFLDGVEVTCFKDPFGIDVEPCFRVRVRTMVDYKLVESDQYIFIVQKINQPGEVIYEQQASEFNKNLPSGVALDGVLIYSAVDREGDVSVSSESSSPERIDRCGGTINSLDDRLYHYRVMPTCILGTPDTFSRRRTYVSDVHELLDYFSEFRGSNLLGYALDGHNIFSPYNDRGLIQQGLDNCNGKVTNGTYAYYSTPWFPYLVGCYGPGVYPLDESEDGISPTNRGLGDVCPGGSFYSDRSSGCVLCPAGSYSVSAYTRGPPCSGVCPLGHYCPEGSKAPIRCPRGRFGSKLGEKSPSCSGYCAEGYFCPAGSWRPDPVPCGNASYFCPTGSSFPQNVLPSFYSIPESSSLKVDQKLCEPGYYCLDGIRHPCPAGVYGKDPGLVSPNCSARCPVGYYCPKNSEIPIPCPAGRYGGHEGSLSDPGCSGECEAGHWCPIASSTPTARRCEGGRYGPVRGLKTSHCSNTCEPSEVISDQGANTLPARMHIGTSYYTSEGLSEIVLRSPFCSINFCKEGYFCPEGSVSATQRECGDASVFCPTGSAGPTPVLQGYYTIGAQSKSGDMQSIADESTRFWQIPCEEGFYCYGGIKRRCPAARYGAHPAEAYFNCSGPCDKGYFCLEGSSDPRQNPCGDPSKFCPEGSPLPNEVPPGFYSVNGTDSTRSAIEKCPRGHYCIGGIKRKCTAGRYSRQGSDSAACDGLCTAGFYCPEGSWSAQQLSCPAGRFGREGMVDQTCLGICAIGHYCPANSTSAFQYECGGEYVYCPVGSKYPLPVDIGFYSAGGTRTTRFKQEKCIYDSEVMGTPPAAATRMNICPATTRWL